MALWLKRHDFKLDQVQNFYPSPMANATTIYHTEMNSLKNIKNNTEVVSVPKGARQRRLHKAILRYHDPAGWPMIREALKKMGKAKLIGNGPNCLVPAESRGEQRKSGQSKGGRPALSRHTGFGQFNKANTKPKVGGNKSRGGKSGNFSKSRKKASS